MKNLYVGNLPHSTTEAELRTLFETHGAVEKVSVVTDRETGRARGFGFVEMTNAGEAEKAIAALNGTQLGGRALTINEAKPKTDRPKEQRRRTAVWRWVEGDADATITRDMRASRASRAGRFCGKFCRSAFSRESGNLSGGVACRTVSLTNILAERFLMNIDEKLSRLGDWVCHEADQHLRSARKNKRASRNNGTKPSAGCSASRTSRKAALTTWTTCRNMPERRRPCSILGWKSRARKSLLRIAGTRARARLESKVKSSGQECPHHTNKTNVKVDGQESVLHGRSFGGGLGF